MPQGCVCYKYIRLNKGVNIKFGLVFIRDEPAVINTRIRQPVLVGTGNDVVDSSFLLNNIIFVVELEYNVF